MHLFLFASISWHEVVTMLVLHVLLAFFAAFGLFCALWAILGFWLPRCRDGWILCRGTSFVPTYLWLRGMGIVNCPLRVLDENLSEEERNWLTFKEIEIWEREST